MAFAWDHPEKRNPWAARVLLRVIEENRGFIAHNAGFEWMWACFFLHRAGLAWEGEIVPEDTMALARLRFNRETATGLDDVSKLVLGVALKDVTQVQAARIMEYPLEETLRYCGLDAQASALLFAEMAPEVHERLLARNYERVKRATVTTSGMAILGLDIDFAEAERQRESWLAKQKAAEERARGLYEVRAFERERGTKLLLSSAIDVGIALAEYGKLPLPRTAKSGQYQTDDDSLRKAAGEEGNPLVDALLDYREAAKMVSTYIDPVAGAKQRCADGRLHPSYNTMLTATLRLSSEDPNIQNFPSRRHKELRRPVVSAMEDVTPENAPGLLGALVRAIKRKNGAKRRLVFCKFDYKALEARVIGMASRDRNLCESTIKGIDIHGKWRDRALELFPEYYDRLVQKTNQTERAKVLKGGRDIIKTDFVFASFYGSSVRSVAERTGMPQDDAMALSEEFWREFSGVKAWVRKQRATYRERGSVFTLTGRERHAILKGNEPINNAIQGTAADIVSEAMNALCALAYAENDPFLHPRIQIHDDLTFILPEARMEDYIEVILKELVAVRFDWQIVPLAVEGMVGETWADMEEFCNHEGSYHR